MITISSKLPITIPTTSPTLRHTPEIERNGVKGGELIKIMSLELRQTKDGKAKTDTGEEVKILKKDDKVTAERERNENSV